MNLRPYLVPILAISAGVLLGPVVAVLIFPDSLSLTVRMGWGLLGGLGCGIILTANRILGAYGDGEW